MKIKKPSFEEVNCIDLTKKFREHQYIDVHENSLINVQAKFNGPDKPPGVEHYKLLGWFSEQYENETLIEIGTQIGLGMISLSHNPANYIVSYDIVDHNPKHFTPANCIRKLCQSNFDHYDEIINSPFIFYDGSHNGSEEKRFFDKLIQLNWKGILMLDDIYLNPFMHEFWKNIENPKEDWTDLGHGFGGAGTGIVFFA